MFRKRDQKVRALSEAIARVLNSHRDIRATVCGLQRRVAHLEQVLHGHCVTCHAPTESVTVDRCDSRRGRSAA